MVKLQGKIKIFSVLVITLLAVQSCSIAKNATERLRQNPLNFDGNLRDVKVFFTKSNKPGEITFVSATRKISKEDGIVSGTIKELFLGPTKTEELRGIMSEIPVGTRLINIEESEDEILVNISTQYVTGGGSASMQLRYLQIYKTLKKIAPYKEIYLQVDGKMLKAIGGEGLEVTQPLTKINDYTKMQEKTEDIQP